MTRTSHSLPRLLSALGLGLLAACGGGGSGPQAPATARTLHYVNPPSTGYRLEADPATNDSARLVLNLVGPSGTLVRGVAFHLRCDGALARWVPPAGDGACARAGTVLDTGADAATRLFRSKVSGGGSELQVGIFQKTGAAEAGTAPLVSVALSLAQETTPPDTAVSLGVLSGKRAIFVDGSGTTRPMGGAEPGTLAVGTLTAR